MEVVAAKALKPSLRTEFIFPQEFCDEFFCFNANNIVVAEDFSVDDLLDFPNGEEIPHYEEEEDEEKNSTTSRDRTEDDTNSNSTAAADADADDSVFAGELSVPADDVADLEWVSHFVDDCLPELSLLYPARSEQARVRSEPEPRPGSTKAHLHSSAIPSKPRTQKTRKPRGGVWSFNAASLCPSVLTSSVSSVDFSEPPVKKQKKRAEAQTGGAQFLRRCSHCQVQKTPQWRTGPLGPKTLCNACGVRFKSGRLFPEYRPACSPTFSGDVHSNSHRKVLEIRRRKETAGPATGSDRTEVVPFPPVADFIC